MSQLALVIDLNVCVGCHACVTSCKEWNTSGWAGPMPDQRPYDADPTGVFFNRVQTYEIGNYPNTETLHFPKSCLHCEEPPCVPVCPYGAREFDQCNRVMKKCTLCVDRITDQNLAPAERKPACVLACPTGARIFGDIHDPDSAASVAIREQGGYQLQPEWGTQPANHYLPRRKTRIHIREDELVRSDNPLKKEEIQLPVDRGESIDDVAW